MIYLIFASVIAWLVYSFINMSVKQNKQMKQMSQRIEILENKINSLVIDKK